MHIYRILINLKPGDQLRINYSILISLWGDDLLSGQSHVNELVAEDLLESDSRILINLWWSDPLKIDSYSHMNVEY